MKDIDSILSKYHSEYTAYKPEFNAAMNCVAADHPMYVDIEVNNYCNMRCKMCRYGMDENENGKENMPIEVLDKLLRDCRAIGVPSYFLGGGTECLVNPKIKDIITHIREIGGGIDDVLITNGYALHDELIDLLLDLKWEKVFISVDAATAETYRKIRGKDLKVVERNIQSLLQKRNERGMQIPVVRLSFVIQPDNIHEKEMFFDKWGGQIEMIDYQDLIDYSDKAIKTGLPEPNARCNAPFNRMFVDWNGEMYPCCTDWGRYLPLGNIRDITVEEAWNGEKMKRLREELLRGKYRDVCKNCLLSIQAAAL